MHPASLARRVPDEVLHALQDPFFKAGPYTEELSQTIVDAVPDADPHQSIMRKWRREDRMERFPVEATKKGRS